MATPHATLVLPRSGQQARGNVERAEDAWRRDRRLGFRVMFRTFPPDMPTVGPYRFRSAGRLPRIIPGRLGDVAIPS